MLLFSCSYLLLPHCYLCAVAARGATVGRIRATINYDLSQRVYDCQDTWTS